MIRITAGEFRGRSLDTPKDLKTRPTQAKLRQALFNSLQVFIPEARVLDLFAGSGALGFEALSRGASEVVFVESSRSVCKLIEKNASTLKVLDRIEIVCDSVDSAVKRMKGKFPFQIVLADPPYAAGWEEKLIHQFGWEAILSEDGRFCLEWGTQKSVIRENDGNLPDSTGNLVKIREKNYGDSMLTTYARPSSISAGEDPTAEAPEGDS